MNQPFHANYRPLLLKLYQQGLQKVKGDVCVLDYFLKNQVEKSTCSVIAIGKAAIAMAQAADQYFVNNIRTGLVITKYGHIIGNNLPENWQVYEAAHPVPDENSLLAGKALIEFTQNLPHDKPVYILLSGGASALVEHPPETVTLESLQIITDWMLSNGLSIHEMNQVRQALSLIKGGGVLNYFPQQINHNNITQLVISDVTDDDLTVIGSGLFIPVKSDIDGIVKFLPEQFHDMVKQQEVVSVNLNPVNTKIIANNSVCRSCIADEACKQNINVYNQTELLTEDVNIAADKIMQILSAGKPGLYIWGGEPTVTLPESPGQGGRNQHLALLLAEKIASNSGYVILCVGTDGTDGPTDAAGALVDGDTVLRGEQAGFDITRTLGNADAGSYLDETGDLVDTGPTGTNVMDIILVLKID